MSSIINNKYKLLEEIGGGSFGKIYKGENVRTKELVAIKIEPVLGGNNLLKNESKIYQYLKNTHGVPEVKWYGNDGKNVYMVIKLLGQSLGYIKSNYSRFTLRSTLVIGIQIIAIIENIHDKGLVHRDLKPDNFLANRENNLKDIYLIDFGLCKTIPSTERRAFGLIGSPNYASLNAHKFIELTRRDDLESLIYVLIYFSVGKLPWENCKLSEIVRLKECALDLACVPDILKLILKYARGLQFSERPDYSYIIAEFRKSVANII